MTDINYIKSVKLSTEFSYMNAHFFSYYFSNNSVIDGYYYQNLKCYSCSEHLLAVTYNTTKAKLYFDSFIYD